MGDFADDMWADEDDFFLEDGPKTRADFKRRSVNLLPPIPEQWKQIPGFPRYFVSDRGRVKSVMRECWRGCVFHHARSVILAQTTGGRAKNYKRVMLQHPKRRHAYVHHLMAEAFLGPRPEGLMVLHRDDNGFNNTLDNLRYGDRDENECDRHVRRVAPSLEEAPF